MLYLLMMQTSNTPLSLPRTFTRLSLPSLWQEELNTEAPCVRGAFESEQDSHISESKWYVHFCWK